ncbi:MAG: hypothetical protein P8N09_00170 [Planctomycetota bacterium]|nr:hypothetical protein [Planctomycetota bacterium]
MNLSPSSFLSRRTSRTLGGVALLAVAFVGSSSAPEAQVDFSVGQIEVNQVIQVSGGTQLVEGRSTFVRAYIRVLPAPATPIPVDGLMRIFVNGVETADSPIYSDNGPFPAIGPNPGIEDGSLNFIFLAPPPTSNCEILIEVNPAGPNFVPEANVSNNTRTTGALSFIELAVPELTYVPIDYSTPSGAPPGVPNPSLIEPGTGDGFVMGIYPSKDWYYHRSDNESKVWTASLSGSGSSLISSLQADRLLMTPVPDYVYGWVPGSLPYNGMATIGGPASMGNTQSIRHQRTFAHEIGHNHGLFHNSITVNTFGIDVEHHLNLTQGLSQLKPSTQRDIMWPGLLTPEAWIGPLNYDFFINHPTFQFPLQLTSLGDEPRMLVNGVWNKQTGAIELHHVLEVPPNELTASAPQGTADFVLRASEAGGSGRELAVSATGVTDCAESDSDSAVSSPLINFHAVIPTTSPNGKRVDRLVFEQAGEETVRSLELVRSASAPDVTFITPTSDPIQSPVITVSWEGVDLDGDEIAYYLRYSRDGNSFSPLATAITETEWTVDLRKLPALVDGKGFFELRATDGFNTTLVRSDPVTGGQAFGGVSENDPWVHMYHPDPDFSFQKGSTVILHCAAWDLEDDALTGSSLRWTSSLDGFLGTGRLTSTAKLSVGNHVITVTGIDGDGQMSSVSRSISVTDRGLPDVDPDVCQTDLGFGGPGSMAISICGGDLSTGTVADMEITGGPASAFGYAFVGLTNAPTSVAGGTLVPVPWTYLRLLVLDGSGEALIANIPGGGGPFSAFVQVVAEDGSQVEGYAFSNALQVDFLP